MNPFSAPEQYAAFSKMRVLIVDDFENFRMSMKKYYSILVSRKLM